MQRLMTINALKTSLLRGSGHRYNFLFVGLSRSQHGNRFHCWTTISGNVPYSSNSSVPRSFSLLDGPRVKARLQPLLRPPRPAQADKPSAAVPAPQQGKRRAPGVFPPGVVPERPEEKRVRDIFAIERDPFRPPTEILPTECPPSMPLCRFDRSQLKLVGIIQVGDGQFKAMVEDPDGRGYFVTSGMQIGGATVTQVSNRGVTLHLHKTQQDVLMPLYREARETSEM